MTQEMDAMTIHSIENKLDLLTETIMDIQKDIGGIEQHLKGMNGTVKRQQERLDNYKTSNKKDMGLLWNEIGEIKSKWIFLTGIVVTIITGANILIALYL